jgi:hypothetical protein
MTVTETVIIDLDYIGVAQPGDGFRFGLETALLLRVSVGTAHEHLQGDEAVQRELAGSETTPMPPRPSSPKIS